jgi:MYXO-CTERM domain-containing protein
MQRVLTLGTLAFVATLAPQPAHPCGMMIARNDTLRFNDALQFAVVRDGTKTTMTLQNKYRGPAEQFALLVPVPVVLREGDVKTLSLGVFEAFEHATAPQLHQYEERDPCEPEDDRDGVGAPGGAARGSGAPANKGVTVESQFVVGEYEVAVLSATEATAVDKWLKDNGYVLPPALASQLRPYVEEGSKFFVAKVDPTKVKLVDGAALLSPLQFTYDAPELKLPIRLSAANSAGQQDVIVYAIAKGDKQLRAANRPNVTMPANVEITKQAVAKFGEFYAAMFAKRLGDKRDAVVTEWAGSADGGWRPGPPLPLEAMGARLTDGAWTLSRLHFVVDKDGVKDDILLVEGPAAPVATAFTYKKQWTGAVDCKRPRYDRFKMRHGGDVLATRDTLPSKTPLAQLVTTDVPDLGIKSEAKFVRADAGGDDGPSSRRSYGPSSKASGGGCCETGDASSAAALAALALVGLVRRRRR